MPEPILPSKEDQKPAVFNIQDVPPDDVPEEPRKGASWLVLAICAAIGGATIIGLVVAFGGKKKPPPPRSPKRGAPVRRQKPTPAALDDLMEALPYEPPTPAAPTNQLDDLMEALPYEPASTALQTSPPAPVPRAQAAAVQYDRGVPPFLPGASTSPGAALVSIAFTCLKTNLC